MASSNLATYITRNQPSAESMRISLTPCPTSGNGRQSLGAFTPLQLPQFVARPPPRRLGKLAQVVKRQSSPVDRLVHLASMYQILYSAASVRLTSLGSYERGSKVDGKGRETLPQETSQRQRATDRNRPNKSARAGESCFEGSDIGKQFGAAERRTTIYPTLGAMAASQMYIGSPTRARTWDLRINRPALRRSVSSIKLMHYLTCARSIFAEILRVMAPYSPLLSLNRPRDTIYGFVSPHAPCC